MMEGSTSLTPSAWPRSSPRQWARVRLKAVLSGLQSAASRLQRSTWVTMAASSSVARSGTPTNSNMAAQTLASVDERLVVRCECGLVQFHSPSESCIRCHRPYVPPEPDEPPLLVAVPSPVPTIATALLRARRRLGLSQRQVARRIPCPRTYVSKLENEKASPTLSSLERVAHALETTTAELLADQEQSRSSRIEQLAADPFVAQVAPFVSRLSAMQRSSVLAQIHEMAMKQRRTA